MDNVNRIFLQMFVVLVCLATVWPQDMGSASITGRVQLDQSTTSLIARLYSPKSEDSQNQQTVPRGEAASHRVRIAFVGADGRFEFPSLQRGSYLLEIYSGERLLYQKVVSTQDKQPLEIVLNARPDRVCAPVGSPIEIYERTYKLLPDPRFHAEVFVYVGDVHRVKSHQNSLYVMIGRNLLPDPKASSNPRRLSTNQLQQLKSGASFFREFLFRREGASTSFSYEGTNYLLTPSKIHDRLGTDNESVTITVCAETQ